MPLTELFCGGGIVFWQPDYVTRLLKPFVDHRLGTSKLTLAEQQATPGAASSSGKEAANKDATADGALVDGGGLEGEMLSLAPAAEEPNVLDRPAQLTAAEKQQMAWRGVQVSAPRGPPPPLLYPPFCPSCPVLRMTSARAIR